jgi:hypothetical protein
MHSAANEGIKYGGHGGTGDHGEEGSEAKEVREKRKNGGTEVKRLRRLLYKCDRPSHDMG